MKNTTKPEVTTIDINSAAADAQTALATTGAKVIKPKPNRTEILEALVRLQLEENARLNQEEWDARKLVQDALALKLRDIVIARIEKLLTPDNIRIRCYGDRAANIDFDLNNDEVPKSLLAEIAKYEAMPHGNRDIYEDRIRREIKEKMKGMESRTSRINAMLADAETRKVLKEMLDLSNAGMKRAA